MDNQTFSNNRFDKKDQLLEINPMALRLSGQSFARAFDEHPLRHFPAFMAKRPADPHQKVQTLEHPEQSELIFSSQFHTEQATERLKA
jgi:predicted SprT family Zn-dependent metalloprotease